MRRMKKICCPSNFRIEPWDSRFYALFRREELVCVTVYKTGAISVMNLLRGLTEAGQELDKLVSDLSWFIENMKGDDQEHSEKFFAIRERVRAWNARTEVDPIVALYEGRPKEEEKGKQSMTGHNRREE